MSQPKLICCNLTCNNQAEFDIYDKLDHENGYTSTQACTQHVGDLLGNCLHVNTDGVLREWTVVEILSDGPSKAEVFRSVKLPIQVGLLSMEIGDRGSLVLAHTLPATFSPFYEGQVQHHASSADLGTLKRFFKTCLRAVEMLESGDTSPMKEVTDD